MSAPLGRRGRTWLAGRDSAEDGLQLIKLDWFDEVGCKAGRLGPLAIAILSPAGDGYERNVLEFGSSADLLGRLKAVHDGHAEVEQHGPWMETIDFGERRGPAMNDADFVAQQAEQPPQAVRGIGIVIHDQNSWLDGAAIRL